MHAISSIESKLVTLSLASKDLIWMRRFLRHTSLMGGLIMPITMYYGNKIAIHLAKNKRFINKFKHILRKYYYIWKLVRRDKVMLEYLPTDKMLADSLTKAILEEKIRKILREMGLLPI